MKRLETLRREIMRFLIAALSNLVEYCELFDPNISIRFKSDLKKKKRLIRDRVGKDIVDSYEQILKWRNAFAHTWARNTTIEEAAETHRVGKRVLYVFDCAFNPSTSTLWQPHADQIAHPTVSSNTLASILTG